jgi:LuxR family maltose regulon positive regulatory protein
MSILKAHPTSDAIPRDLPVLKSKLTPPPYRSELIARPQFYNYLSPPQARSITLLVAPAGYGKTTVLIDWLHYTQKHEAQLAEQRRIVWLSLDESDNDPASFWAYLQAAIRPEGAWLGPERSYEAALIALINSLIDSQETLLVLIDNYQTIHNPEIHSLMQLLIEHIPSSIQLVLASRTLPPWPIARLRAQARLDLLDAEQLRLDSNEARALLDQIVIPKAYISDSRQLLDRCEGWPAALYLAATGGEQALIDFISQEIIAGLPQQLQDLLLYTALPATVNATLVSSLLRRASEIKQQALPDSFASAISSTELFLYLQRYGVPFVKIDQQGEWFRYPHILHDLLRTICQRNLPEMATKLQRSCAAWFEQQQMLPEAIQSALAAKDYSRSSKLIERIADTMLWQSGDLTTLLAWLGQTPEKVFRQSPQLSLIRIWAWMLEGRLEAVDAYLHGIEQSFYSTSQANQDQLALYEELQAIRALLHAYRWGDPQQVEAWIEQGPYSSDQNTFLRGTLLLSAGIAHRRQGNVVLARELLMHAVSCLRAAGNTLQTLLALSNLAIVQIVQGRLSESMHTCTQAHQLVENWGLQDTPVASAVYMRLPFLLYERNELQAAVRAAEHGIALARRSANLEIMLHCYLGMGYIKQALGDHQAAIDVMHSMLQIAERYGNLRWLGQINAFRTTLFLMEGQIGPAIEWANDYASQEHYEIEDLVLVRVYLAQYQDTRQAYLLDLAHEILNLYQYPAEQAGRMSVVAEILLLRALVYDAQGKQHTAIQTLLQSLQISAPERFVRLYLNEGHSMMTLLTRTRAYADPALYWYIDYLIHSFQPPAQLAETHPDSILQGSALPLQDSLSDHERAILQLLVSGHSNQEIGQARCLSVNTVKWHLKNIYSKLQVNSREQARLRAQSLRLV